MAAQEVKGAQKVKKAQKRASAGRKHVRAVSGAGRKIGSGTRAVTRDTLQVSTCNLETITRRRCGIRNMDRADWGVTLDGAMPNFSNFSGCSTGY
jgi:hypothetical protein